MRPGIRRKSLEAKLYFASLFDFNYIDFEEIDENNRN